MRDLRAALAYLRSRPDRDPAGFGLFGVSRGGGTALVVAADDPGVWGVVTDGAFPTRGTMLAYILRWAEIYVSQPVLLALPARPGSYVFVGWAARVRSAEAARLPLSRLERAVARLAPRPWLMIHGAKDTYIGPEIARSLFARAGEPKEFWLVPVAKHNRCREVEPEAYAERIRHFFGRYAPRRALLEARSASPGPPARPEPPRSRRGPAAGGIRRRGSGRHRFRLTARNGSNRFRPIDLATRRLGTDRPTGVADRSPGPPGSRRGERPRPPDGPEPFRSRIDTG